MWGHVVDYCKHGNETSGYIYAGNLVSSCRSTSFLGRTLLHGVTVIILIIIIIINVIFMQELV
jgi:hypothetical protein